MNKDFRKFIDNLVVVTKLPSRKENIYDLLWNLNPLGICKAALLTV